MLLPYIVAWSALPERDPSNETPPRETTAGVDLGRRSKKGCLFHTFGWKPSVAAWPHAGGPKGEFPEDEC